MKKTLYFIIIPTVLVALASCEKFELDDHCPEENQEQYVDPNDLRVSDDSDSEESGKPIVKSEEDSAQGGQGNIRLGNGSDDSETGNPDGDEVINDDSDDEDESGKPRNPNENSGGSSNGTSIK